MREFAMFLPLAQTAAAPEAARPAPAGGPAPSVTGSGGGAAGTAAPGGAPVDPKAAAPGGFLSGGGGMLMLIPMLLILYFVLFRGQRKTEKKRKEMIAELKKGDRIMTIGGMLAKVVSVDGEEVVLKIDEAANVKATYRKSAIQEVIDDDKK